jgi:hypothetical protein
VRAAEGGADAVGQLVRAEQAVRLDDPAPAVDPVGLDRVQPGALGGQEAGDDADAAAGRLDLAVVPADPAADLPAEVPGGILPDREQRRLAEPGQPRAAPVQELRGDAADGPAVDEAQPF